MNETKDTNTEELLMAARRASKATARLSAETVDGILTYLADRLTAEADTILEANAADMARIDPADPKADRLLLTPARIADIAAGLRQVATLPSPLGKTLSTTVRPNGMMIRKVTVPFGVIGVIFESRPNVAFDVFALCFKAGSACVLKGGHEASETCRAAVALSRSVLADHGADANAAVLLEGHEATDTLLQARGTVDLIIPRGSRRLIDYVRDRSRVPVIETGAGVCHTYYHSSGDTATCRDIVLNAKTRRVSVCNALDCLVVDRSRLGTLAAVCFPLADRGVEIHADEEAYAALEGSYPHLVRASEGDFGREWLDYKLTVKTVGGIDEALDFIGRHGSHHSECIVAESADDSRLFLSEVDAACVYANVSTAFTDGGQFGFGAEIGISTQKLHARGPMALPELTTYKYLITGSGQTRS